jgi:outer membrane protein assembly factor BamB
VIATVVWERPLHQRGRMRDVVAAGDRIVAHERGTRLVGLDRADGTAVWDVATGTWPRNVALAGDRCLIVPQSPDRLQCVDLGTGTEQWRVELGPVRGNLVATDDTVVVGGWRGYTAMSAYDLRDGRPLWQHQARAQLALPVHWGGGVLTGEDREVRLIEPRGGGPIATWRLPEPLITVDDGTPFTVLDPQRCLVLCKRGSVVVLDGRSGAAEEIVRFGGDVAVPAVLAGDRVWVRSARHGYEVIDPVSAAPVFRVDLGARCADGVARIGDGSVVATCDGVLVAVGPDGQVVDRVSHARRTSALHDLGDDTLLMTTRGTLRRVAVRL